MDKKTKILNLLAQGYQEEMAFIAGRPAEEWERPGTFEAWAPKDILAHNGAWKERLAENIQLALSGKTPTRNEDFDHENAQIFTQYKDKSLEEILNLSTNAHEKLYHLIESLAEETLNSADVLPWQEGQPLWRLITGNGYTHPLIHLIDHFQKQGKIRTAGELLGRLANATLELADDDEAQGVARYNLACSHALLGQKEAAINELRQALELNPGLTEWSQQDPDLENLRGEAGYQAIYTAGSS